MPLSCRRRTSPKDVLKVFVGSRRLVKDCDWDRLIRRGVQGVAAGVDRRLLEITQDEVGTGFKLDREAEHYVLISLIIFVSVTGQYITWGSPL